MLEEEREPETTPEPTDKATEWPAYHEGRAAAVESLRRKRGFLGHCAAYLIVNGLLVTLWLVLGITSGAWFFWPIFPMAGWGIGLAFNAVSAYGPANRPITEAEIQTEIQQLNLH